MLSSRRVRVVGVVIVGGLLVACAAAGPVTAGTRPPSEGASERVSERVSGEGPAGPPAARAGGTVAPPPAVRPSSASGSNSADVSAGCGSAPYGVNFYAPDFGGGKTVALTFDDGPGPTTPGIIKVLREYRVPATFFNIGQNAAAYPSLVRAEATDGYLVGNHTWNHPEMPTLSASAQAAELDEATAEQESLIGWGPCAFRPPYGDYDTTTLTLAQQRHMKVWYWSVDTQDWEADGSSSSYWVDRIISLAESEGGSQDHPVVLMHNAPSGDPATVQALPTIISYFRDRGYTFVNLAGDTGTGYYVLASNGTVHGYGTPAAGPAAPGAPAVGLVTDPDTGGYWLLKASGVVVAYRAPYYGDLAGKLAGHVRPVAIAASRGGYLVLTSDGRVHAFGAPFHGQPAGTMGALEPVGLAVDAATGGYWILNSAGGVWNYDAPWYGSLAGQGYRVAAIAPSPLGGYLLLTAAGRVSGFHATSYGSAGRLDRKVTAVGMTIAPATGGYWILLSNGAVLPFHALWLGSLTGKVTAQAAAAAIAGV
jgi:peptidoglycan/xylan/chitin deacetylase (PgdA/CDA1 family)